MSGRTDKPDDEGFLSRWSRKKVEARTSPAANPQPQAPELENPSTGALSGPKTPQTPRQSSTLASTFPSPEPPAPRPELPSLESLTPDADFTPFMAQGVEANTRTAALKTLFTDPHFNKMDGLDVYIDDYTQHTPIPMEMLRSLKQAQMLFADEKNEEGDQGVPPPEKIAPKQEAMPGTPPAEGATEDSDSENPGTVLAGTPFPPNQ
ncbi:MAG: DUF3306 domain-containing protein [Betaproteobacteria bacterium]|nr:DUF3306 domain-containing protein [Betaproteobacteria bacterium]